MRLGDAIIADIESVIAAGQQQCHIISARAAEVAALVLARATSATSISLFSHLLLLSFG